MIELCNSIILESINSIHVNFGGNSNTHMHMQCYNDYYNNFFKGNKNNNKNNISNFKFIGLLNKLYIKNNKPYSTTFVEIFDKHKYYRIFVFNIIENELVLYTPKLEELNKNLLNDINKISPFKLKLFNLMTDKKKIFNSIVTTIPEKEKLIISNSNNPIGNSFNLNNLSSLNISSSSHEDNEAIIRRLNNSSNLNNLSSLNISSSSHENNETIMRRLNNDLINFIDNNELSFYHIDKIKEDNTTSFYIHCNKNIIDKTHLITFNIMYEVKNNTYFITKVKTLDKLNIKIENGRNFFLNNEISNNLLIKYLQSIEKNNKEGLKFCLNILKLYNHKDYKKFAIYSNLYNTDINFKQNKYFCEKKMKEIIDSIKFDNINIKLYIKYMHYTDFGYYKEANNLLIRHHDNKKIISKFLKIILMKQYNCEKIQKDLIN